MKTTIYSQHQEHTVWLNKLSFYVDDMAIMQKRIEEIAKKNTAKEVQMQVEHFQNKFIVLKEVIDNLSHDIKGKEAAVELSAANSPSHIGEHTLVASTELFSRMKNLSNDFIDSRFELNKFLSKTL